MSQKIITHQLDQVLKQVDRPGNFATSGHFRFYPPNLSVKGIGTIAFPLLPIQAEQLISVASPAPFGRGEETLFLHNTTSSIAKQCKTTSIIMLHGKTLPVFLRTLQNSLN
jgi:hypothetical protein